MPISNTKQFAAVTAIAAILTTTGLVGCGPKQTPDADITHVQPTAPAVTTQSSTPAVKTQSASAAVSAPEAYTAVGPVSSAQKAAAMAGITRSWNAMRNSIAAGNVGQYLTNQFAGTQGMLLYSGLAKMSSMEESIRNLDVEVGHKSAQISPKQRKLNSDIAAIGTRYGLKSPSLEGPVTAGSLPPRVEENGRKFFADVNSILQEMVEPNGIKRTSLANYIPINPSDITILSATHARIMKQFPGAPSGGLEAKLEDGKWRFQTNDSLTDATRPTQANSPGTQKWRELSQNKPQKK